MYINPNPVYRLEKEMRASARNVIIPGTTPPNIPRKCTSEVLQEVFNGVGSWIAEHGSLQLNRLYSEHMSLWETVSNSMCAKSRRQRELIWLATSEGFICKPDIVPPPIDRDILMDIYKQSGFISHKLNEYRMKNNIAW